MKRELIHKIFNPDGAITEADVLEVFRFQYENNFIYKAFTDSLGIVPEYVNASRDIPFLPVSFFKTHRVATTSFQEESVFESSGTTGSVNSRHFIRSLAVYKQSYTKCFRQFYGPPEEWCIIGLLPSYLERSNSSLVVMVNDWIAMSAHPESGFYLNEYAKLKETLELLEQSKQKTLLIGVSFALLDFAEKYPLALQSTIIMETGGMKGRRQEMIREELHAVLKEQLQVDAIHSEYGMTELLSQAYSRGSGLFFCPPWMKILLREEDDPLHITGAAEVTATRPASGLINVIDLANLYSCSFIATDDAGRLYDNGSFEVVGRRDNSDLRGCSLMVL
ncbi:MAG: acyl transferase [Chitinophagaceae bacterium]|nr:acyl transferase [Chitinophagaceae bacterium]